MKYVITKDVKGFKYYWCALTKRWEGLIDNATKYTVEEGEKIINILHAYTFLNCTLTKVK